ITIIKYYFMANLSTIKTSLIITVFNRVHLLRKSLISLKNQSIKPGELIISDDGSSEDIASGIFDIVKEFDFPVNLVRQEKEGFRLAKCRNNAVKFSTGDLLIFLDQDIIHTDDFIKTFIENRKKNRFVTSYPIRLTEKQSEEFTEEIIANGEFLSLVKSQQLNKIKKQFLKDYISFVGHKFRLVKQKPKLRGGVCAINREDYYAVNGYDENFVGWGNEDDDIRKRLYSYGVSGYNPFFVEFPLHLYHEPFHNNGERVNTIYSAVRSTEIAKGNYYCEDGISKTNLDELIITQLN
ncbi:MAG: glycosyltransferase, partial [Melioribacteraceae bacterium]|nr:glycosyltransferase [Melioribacteraceae bacterium]